jgi:lipoate---protein ligase
MKLNLVVSQNLAIHEQLRYEEALLRTDDQNWCIINQGSRPSIVLGSSNCPKEMIDYKNPAVENLHVIKRFSGGGTVVVDQNTIFVTFIFNAKEHPFHPFPEPILRWSANFYQKALKLKGFSLKENDYALDDKKIAGNAQYLKKNRWLHHSTFLYDYKPELMNCLQHPTKKPLYRGERQHKDFITTLKPYIASKSRCVELLCQEVQAQFDITLVPIECLTNMEFIEHRQVTHRIPNPQTLSDQNIS